jgi:hypothetical protein
MHFHFSSQCNNSTLISLNLCLNQMLDSSVIFSSISVLESSFIFHILKIHKPLIFQTFFLFFVLFKIITLTLYYVIYFDSLPMNLFLIFLYFGFIGGSSVPFFMITDSLYQNYKSLIDILLLLFISNCFSLSFFLLLSPFIIHLNCCHDFAFLLFSCYLIFRNILYDKEFLNQSHNISCDILLSINLKNLSHMFQIILIIIVFEYIFKFKFQNSLIIIHFVLLFFELFQYHNYKSRSKHSYYISNLIKILNK